MCAQRSLIVHEQAKSPIAEAFRTLRTNLQFSKVDGGLHTVLFTSAGPGEGKSTVIANTAVAMAQSGKRVLLVDCDLRKPTQHRIFHLNRKGITNSIVEDIPITELIQETEIANLRVVTSGPIPPNPSELLGSAHMHEILATLQKDCDLLLIDAPPAVAVTDACVLASQVDGVVIVLDSDVVRPDMAQKTRDLIRKANGNILGVILNRVEIEKEHSYYYYYYGKDAKKR